MRSSSGRMGSESRSCWWTARRSSRLGWRPIFSEGLLEETRTGEIENLRKGPSAGTIEADWTNPSLSNREDPPDTRGYRGEASSLSPCPGRTGGARPFHHVIGGPRRGRRSQFGQGTKGPLLSGLLRYSGGRLRRGIPHPPGST